jgi:hypothetical protein
VKILAMAVGAAILFTTAHVTVLATGGYGGSHAYITLAVAAGVSVASILVGRAWSERRRTLAVCLVIAIAAGEVYAFLGTAERLTAAREATQAPLRQALEARQKLETRVAKAEAALAALPEASARFREAMRGKMTADAAVVTKSAERGCAANCRLLLQAQADQNQQEVEAARRDMAENRVRLEQAVADAKGELAAFKAPPSPSPLADRIGWQAWVLDLVMAGLGSLSANGLACLMMVFGSHRRSENADTTEATETASEVAPAIVLEPLDQPQDFADAQSAKVVQLRPAGPSKRRAKAVDRATPDPDAVQHGKSFMVARVTRTDGDATTDVRALHRDYVTWCEARGMLPKPTAEIGPALLHLFDLAKIPISQKDGRPVALGIALKS